MTTQLIIGRKNGELVDAVPTVIPVHEIAAPATAFIRSAAPATHKIEISVDGGIEFFEPVYDFESATQKAVAIATPISHLRLTGVAGSVWGIL